MDFELPPKLIPYNHVLYTAELFNINCIASDEGKDRDTRHRQKQRQRRERRAMKVLGVSANTKGFDPCPYSLTFDEWTRIRYGMNEHFK